MVAVLSELYDIYAYCIIWYATMCKILANSANIETKRNSVSYTDQSFSPCVLKFQAHIYI